MTLRPASACWFELLTSQEELGVTLDCLATTGLVQLQAYSGSESRLALPDLRNTLAEYETLARNFGHFWPAPRRHRPEPEYRLLEIPREACDRLHAWASDAGPLIAELESLTREQEENELVEQLSGSSEDLPRLDRIATAGPVLSGRVYAMGHDEQSLVMPPSVMTQRLSRAAGDFVLALGPRDEIAELDTRLAAREARLLHLPGDLPSDPTQLPGFLEARSAELARREASARVALEQLNDKHGVADALGELAQAAWLVANVPEFPVTEHFAWITGWCRDKDDTRLRSALDERGLHYLLRFTETPVGEQPPTVLHNPAWARPFELFAGLMGVPGSREADPSILLALIAPLMFGFMFGDVFQGAVLVLAGLILHKRLPALRLLVAGGACSIAFGFAFGSVLGREDLVPALWIEPLKEPLTVLGSALGFGIAVIGIGLLINAAQFRWRGEGRRWIATDAGLLVAYIGLVAGLIDTRALWAVPIGVTWNLAGAAGLAETNRVGALGNAAGALLEHLLQLAVNTVSFVRVGAFALAHAGLCTAVVGVAEAAGAGYWVVLLAGNAVIIVLEGLVVGIQTTRLILFEFFIRFLTAGGRPFLPLAPPGEPTTPTSGRKP